MLHSGATISFLFGLYFSVQYALIIFKHILSENLSLHQSELFFSVGSLSATEIFQRCRSDIVICYTRFTVIVHVLQSLLSSLPIRVLYPIWDTMSCLRAECFKLLVYMRRQIAYAGNESSIQRYNLSDFDLNSNTSYGVMTSSRLLPEVLFARSLEWAVSRDISKLVTACVNACWR